MTSISKNIYKAIGLYVLHLIGIIGMIIVVRQIGDYDINSSNWIFVNILSIYLYINSIFISFMISKTIYKETKTQKEIINKIGYGFLLFIFFIMSLGLLYRLSYRNIIDIYKGPIYYNGYIEDVQRYSNGIKNRTYSYSMTTKNNKRHISKKKYEIFNKKIGNLIQFQYLPGTETILSDTIK